jgi:hypothetical protein
MWEQACIEVCPVGHGPFALLIADLSHGLIAGKKRFNWNSLLLVQLNVRSNKLIKAEAHKDTHAILCQMPDA